MFIYDSLNGFVHSPELLSIISFNVTNYSTRKSNLFHIEFYKRNYSSAYFLPRALLSADHIVLTLSVFILRYKIFLNKPYNKLSFYLLLNFYI